jgi:hypothetical protein
MRFFVVNDRQPQGRTLTRLTLLRVARSCCQCHADLRIASPRRPLNSLAIYRRLPCTNAIDNLNVIACAPQ